MLPAFWSLRNSASEMRFAVASSTGFHSRTTLVCVALRHRREGVDGSAAPKHAYIWSCNARKERSVAASEVLLRATVMSTIEPDEMSGGRRMEGNSIWTAELA